MSWQCLSFRVVQTVSSVWRGVYALTHWILFCQCFFRISNMSFRAYAGKNQKIVRNMESWGPSKSLETSTKLKLLLGGIILSNFSVQIFMVPKILQIKECTKCRPEIYWPELKNAIIQAWIMQMCWNLACEPFSWKILCLQEKKSFFFFIMTDMCCFSHFQDVIFPSFLSKIFICCKIFISSVVPFLKLEAKCYRIMQRNPWTN